MMRHGTCVSVCRESSTAAAARSGWQLRCGQPGVAALCSNLSICRQWRGRPLSQIPDMQGHATRGIFCFCRGYNLPYLYHSMPSILLAIHENIFQIFKSMFSIYQELHIAYLHIIQMCASTSNRMDIGQAEISQCTCPLYGYCHEISRSVCNKRKAPGMWPS